MVLRRYRLSNWSLSNVLHFINGGSTVFFTMIFTSIKIILRNLHFFESVGFFFWNLASLSFELLFWIERTFPGTHIRAPLLVRALRSVKRAFFLLCTSSEYLFCVCLDICPKNEKPIHSIIPHQQMFPEPQSNFGVVVKFRGSGIPVKLEAGGGPFALVCAPLKGVRAIDQLPGFLVKVRSWHNKVLHPFMRRFSVHISCFIRTTHLYVCALYVLLCALFPGFGDCLSSCSLES